jgi:hypothetical protein
MVMIICTGRASNRRMWNHIKIRNHFDNTTAEAIINMLKSAYLYGKECISALYGGFN